MVNAKHMYRRLCSAFEPSKVFEASYEDLLAFCDGIPARIEFVHSVFEVYESGDEKFRFEACSAVKRIRVAMEMTKEMLQDGFKVHLGTKINKLVYDLVHLNPKNIFSKFEEIFMDETRGDKEYGKNSVNKYFKNHPNLDDFNDQFDLKYEQVAWYEKWSRTHPFRAELYDSIVDWVTKRTQHTSSKPEISARASISRYVNTLRLLATYVDENCHPPGNGVDCLQWFFSVANIDTLNKGLIHIIENDVVVRNDLVRSENSARTGTEFVYAFASVAKVVLAKYFSNKQDALNINVNYILNSSQNKREVASRSERRHFLPSEIMVVENYVNDTQNSMWQLVFVILKEVGLRIYALTSLKVSHFLNSKNCIVDSVSVLEKQRRWRTFLVSDSMRLILEKYLDEFPVNKTDRTRYLFRSQTSSHSARYSPENISHKVKQFCNSAGVVGNFVHVHAFRHTLVNSLMKFGNKIENVSKYMGHSSVSTTEKYYWTDNVTNIVSSMNVPWLTKRTALPRGLVESHDDQTERGLDQSDDEDEEKCAACDVLFHVVLAYHSELTDTQKANIKHKIPNIENIFDTMCSESLC
jgi:integrase